jgi:hypothetical protein
MSISIKAVFMLTASLVAAVLSSLPQRKGGCDMGGSVSQGQSNGKCEEGYG